MEDDERGADVDLVAVAERNAARERLLSDRRTVLAAEILEYRAALAHHDPRMTARDAGHIEQDGRRLSPWLNTMRRAPTTIHRLTGDGWDDARSTGAANA